jgi:hypothetical protein
MIVKLTIDRVDKDTPDIAGRRPTSGMQNGSRNWKYMSLIWDKIPTAIPALSTTLDSVMTLPTLHRRELFTGNKYFKEWKLESWKRTILSSYTSCSHNALRNFHLRKRCLHSVFSLKNMEIAVGISLISHSIPHVKSTSGFRPPSSISEVSRSQAMSEVSLLNRLLWKMWV